MSAGWGAETGEGAPLLTGTENEEALLTPAAEGGSNDTASLIWPLIGMSLVVFVSSMDNTILSVSLPTIAAELPGSAKQYSWVGTSYLLSQTVMAPINGRLVDVAGRRLTLFTAIGFILIFSTLSGIAKDVKLLIIARALTGIGGGSIVGLTPIIISDMVPMNRRGAVQGYMGLAGSFAGAVGPVAGGWLTQKYSWRWCFYANVPLCLLSIVILRATLKLPEISPNDLRGDFDYIGVALIPAAAGTLVLGFTNATDEGFGSTASLIPIIAGAGLCVLSCWHILTTTARAIIPPALLRTRTPAFFLCGTFCQSLMFVPMTFLLPQFFQAVKGNTSTESGTLLAPFTIGIALFGFIGGYMSGYLVDVRPLIYLGYLLQLVAYAMFVACFDSSINVLAQEALVGICAGGIGLALPATMLVIQASVPTRDMAAATSGWVLIRSLGPSTGLALHNSLLSAQMHMRFAAIPGFGTKFNIPLGTSGYQAIHRLKEPLLSQVLKSLAASFRACWTVGAILMAAALTLCLCTTFKQLRQDDKRYEGREISATFGE